MIKQRTEEEEEEERDLINDLKRYGRRFPINDIFFTSRFREEEEEEEEEEFFNHYKNDLKRHAHTPSGVAGADLKS